MNSKYLKSKPHGFTLIEVMIAIAIMATIVYITTKSVNESSKFKAQLNAETEVNSDLRAGYFLIDRDISQIFTPLSMMPKDFKPLDPYEQQTDTQGQNGKVTDTGPTAQEVNQMLNGNAFTVSEYWGPVIHNSGIRDSRFKGDATSMSFVAFSHVRVYAEKKESIFNKVRLSIQNSTRQEGLSDLMRTSDTQAFRLDEPNDPKTVRTIPILTGIKDFKFEYFKRGSQEPLSTWDNIEQLDTKGMLPDMIRVSFQLIDRDGRSIDQQWTFRLEVKPRALPATF